MKNTIKVLGTHRLLCTVAMAVVIGFLMVACGDGSGGGNGGDPTSITYTSEDETTGNVYTLVVTKNPNRTAYVPQNGDAYVLTIKDQTGNVIGISTGIVDTIEDEGTTFVLKKDGASENIFTVSISGSAIELISNPIPLDGDNDKTMPPPISLKPVKPSGGGTLIVSGEYKYSINADESTVTIINYTGAGGVVEIPSQLNGKTVTGIGEGAFWDRRDSLTSVIIPNSVTIIGVGAFTNCSGLASVTIPDSVTSIRNSAFTGCSGLTSVTIGNNVTSIGNSAFYGCTSLIDITIPNRVISIGRQAFNGCSSLTSVTIGSSVTNIEDAAFSGCTSLVSVTFVTGSNITSGNFGSAFPVGSEGTWYTSDSLNNAYLAANPKAGTYTRESGGYFWTKQP